MIEPSSDLRRYSPSPGNQKIREYSLDEYVPRSERPEEKTKEKTKAETTNNFNVFDYVKEQRMRKYANDPAQLSHAKDRYGVAHPLLTPVLANSSDQKEAFRLAGLPEPGTAGIGIFERLKAEAGGAITSEEARARNMLSQLVAQQQGSAMSRPTADVAASARMGSGASETLQLRGEEQLALLHDKAQGFARKSLEQYLAMEEKAAQGLATENERLAAFKEAQDAQNKADLWTAIFGTAGMIGGGIAGGILTSNPAGAIAGAAAGGAVGGGLGNVAGNVFG